MDDSPINLENILEQAPKWTFAGDYTLLQWMQQVSQDLESRATKTTDALIKLNNNIKSTNVALDNVANSLATLHFGNQFVECRVHDDDETLANFNESSRDKENQPETTATSKEMLNTFLENNLKVLRNCHERYSIDLEDSDEEEISKGKTCIYQPINPYNEKPLPYIFGSKDWHAKWHVGLYENQQDNSYSDDETSEGVSETSSTSHLDDNESFESNTEWASINSIDNDNFNSNIEIKNASSLRGSQPLYPGAPTPFNAGKSKPATISESSSSVSTTPSSGAKKSVQDNKQNAILTKKSESMNSMNSGTSSKPAAKISANKKENTLQYKSPKQNVVDLFAEPIEDNESKTSSSVFSDQNVKRVETNNQPTTTAIRTQPRPFVDLFAEPPEDFSSSTASSLSSSHNTKRKIVNLFDDDDDADNSNMILSNEDELKKPENKENTFLPSVAKAATKIPSSVTKTSKALFDEIEVELKRPENEENTGKPSTVIKTSKSLFDDSDDDDDFLKAFVKKSLPKEATKSSLSKTLLFDNEINNSTINSSPQSNDHQTETNNKPSTDKLQNLFDKTETKADLLSNKFTKVESPISTHKAEQDASIKSSNTSPPVSSFLDKPTVEENAKKSSEKEFHDFVAETKTKKINLFDDLDDGEDLFSTTPKNIKEIFQKTGSKEVVKKPKDNTIKFVEDKTIIKDTEKVIENILSKSDSLQDDNTIKYQVERVEKSEIISQNLFPETFENSSDNKTLQVFKKDVDKEKGYEQTAKQEQNNVKTIPQSTENEIVSIPEDKNQQQNSSSKYEFNSILFSDEPPEDDDEFFESLAKTSSTLNSNYSAIDLENDIFEPELPKVPVANASSNQNDSVDNFYTGLQLFSDIPPDDDAMVDSTSIPPPATNKIKRLHGVFYDDFNETLMALNQKHIEKEIPNHSIFNQEPPAINEDLKLSSKDLTDHKVPEKNYETISNDFKTKLRDNNNKSEETAQQTNDGNRLEFANKRPVSKLKMPHININVQALLPGASNTLRQNSKEDHKNSIVIAPPGDDTKQAVYISGSSSSDSQLNLTKTINLAKTSRTAETEHILPHITKNRVKAPAARRPSTRRARQENYRKSLVEQQKTLACDEENPKINSAQTKNIISQSLLQESTKDTDFDIPENTHSPQITNTASTSLPSQNKNATNIIKITKDDNLHDVKNVQGEEPKSNKSVHNVENPSNSAMLSYKSREVNSNDLQEVKSINKTAKDNKFTPKSKPLNASLYFEDDEEEDEDFFKHIKTATILDNQKTKDNEKSLTRNDSLHVLETKTNMTVTQENRQSQTLNKDFPIDNERSTKKQQTAQAFDIQKSKQLTTNKSKSFLDEDDDDDEDLFKTAITPPRSSLSYKERNMKAKSEFKSFLDSETDEEPNVAGLLKKTPTLPTTAAPEKLKNNNTITPFKQKDENKPNVFSDSETDSDGDLFGKLSSTKVSKNKKVLTTNPEPKSSLFEDESDSDNFLTSARSSHENTESKISSNKKNVPKNSTQTNTSLFSDLDSDEDDLFGGGAAKITSSNVTNAKNVKATSTSQTTISAAESSKSKTVDDNPLADLL